MKKLVMIAVIVLAAVGADVYAQGSGGPTGVPTPVPIDGGASLLLAAGAAFGLKKVNDYRKKNKQDL